MKIDNQPSLWGREYHKIVIERAEETIKMIPGDVRNILDVGCGDGLLTNKIHQSYFMVGLDISLEALKYIKKDKVNASINSLPFNDMSFDLLILSEVLEHLPDKIYRKALTEVERVSKKYILVTVPYEEYLPLDFARCLNCGAIFHGAGHTRSFSVEDAENLFSNFSPIFKKEICYIPRRELGTKLEIFIRQNLGGDYFHYSESTICPVCGELVNKRAPRGLFSYLAAAIRRIQGLFIYGKIPKWFGVLYQKNI